MGRRSGQGAELIGKRSELRKRGSSEGIACSGSLDLGLHFSYDA